MDGGLADPADPRAYGCRDADGPAKESATFLATQFDDGSGEAAFQRALASTFVFGEVFKRLCSSLSRDCAMQSQSLAVVLDPQTSPDVTSFVS
jgi:hypothetical protein